MAPWVRSTTSTGIMMCGLQGSGKTTTVGKLAKFVEKTHKKKAMLVAADIYRPAAAEQLKTLGRQLDVPTLDRATSVQQGSRRCARGVQDRSARDAPRFAPHGEQRAPPCSEWRGRARDHRARDRGDDPPLQPRRRGREARARHACAPLEPCSSTSSRAAAARRSTCYRAWSPVAREKR